MKKKIAFIVRGNLKDPDKFRSNISAYFQQEFDIYLRFTKRIGHAIEIVQQLMDENLDYLVGVGGDGTFSEVINGYMLAKPELRENVILAVFPRGAGNDFARSCGQIESMEHLYKTIKSGQSSKLDLVEVKYTDAGKPITRYYGNSFDIGLGGLACMLVNKSGKTWGSNFTYFFSILMSFLSFKRLPIEIKSDDGFHFKGHVLIAVFNNGKYFGSGLGIAPKAQLNDGLVNVVIARNINILQFLWYTPRLRKCKEIKNKELFYHQLSACTITSSATQCPMEFDGEVTGTLPINLKVIKHAATLIKP